MSDEDNSAVIRVRVYMTSIIEKLQDELEKNKALLQKLQEDGRKDYEAVCNLTGCSKMFGAQGRAPDMHEMIEEYRVGIDNMLAESTENDLVGFDHTSVIASLLLRLKDKNKVTKVEETLWHH